MLLSILLSAFATLFTVSQALKSKQCTKELAGIVYNVQNPQADYLNRISKTLLAQKPLLFSPDESVAIYKSFVQTYQVSLKVIDAFGQVTIYNADGTVESVTDGIEYNSTNWARSFLNFPSFKIRDGNAYLTFGVFNENAEYLAFTIFEQAGQL